jgi:hypothetical protein
MNFSFNGPIWRASLKAVPENRRSEVLGTLTECYGGSAPVSEAFRTFTSGSRMRNRAEAASALELWRIALRSALIFSLALKAGMTLARWALPFEYRGRTLSIWTLFFEFLTLLIAAGLGRNRYSRVSAGLFLGISSATVVLRDSASFGPEQFPHLFPAQVMSAVAMLAAGCLILSLHRKPRWVFSIGAFALAGSQIVGWTNGPFLFSRRWEIYSLVFGAAYTIAFAALIVLSTRSTEHKSKSRARTPLAMGFGFAVLGNFIDSTVLSKHFSQLVSHGLQAAIAVLIATALLLVFVRPRLYISTLFVLLINFLPVMPWRFSGEGVRTPLLLSGFCVLLLFLGRSGSRRALRV